MDKFSTSTYVFVKFRIVRAAPHLVCWWEGRGIALTSVVAILHKGPHSIFSLHAMPFELSIDSCCGAVTNTMCRNTNGVITVVSAAQAIVIVTVSHVGIDYSCATCVVSCCDYHYIRQQYDIADRRL